MFKQILSTAKVVILALVLSFGLSYALAWTAPTATPPGANVAAPLNVSATAQTKTGGITAGSLTTTGLTTTGTLRVTTGAGATKVLTSDASGNATWQTPSTGADNLGNHTATQALNMAGYGINSAGTVNTGRINASEASGAYSYISMADDTSTGGAKFVHANSNVIGFLKGGGASWLSYWTDAGNQVNTGTVTASDVYGGGKWLSATQNRVSGTCAVGSAVRVVNADGTVTCGTFAGTAVYQEATVAPLVCDGSICATGCGGEVTFAPTCSAVNACTAAVYWNGSEWYRKCATSQTTYNNTLKGKLVP